MKFAISTLFAVAASFTAASAGSPAQAADCPARADARRMVASQNTLITDTADQVWRAEAIVTDEGRALLSLRSFPIANRATAYDLSDLFALDCDLKDVQIIADGVDRLVIFVLSLDGLVHALTFAVTAGLPDGVDVGINSAAGAPRFSALIATFFGRTGPGVYGEVVPRGTVVLTRASDTNAWMFRQVSN